MSVYGGLEYTEAAAGPGATFLLSYPGTGTPGALVPPVSTVTVGGTQIGFYNVAPGNLVGLAGAQRATDWEVLRDGRVRLTNDTISAEWVIEGHTVAGLTVAAMMQNMKQDIAKVIGLRQQLRGAITALQTQYPGDYIILAPAAAVDLRVPGPQGLFEYAPGVQVLGSAQITIQYDNLQTLTRISKLNASKYLPGTKVAVGDDAAMVTDTLNLVQRGRYNIGQSSFPSAQTLLQGLTAIANPVVIGAVTHLTAAQVGLIMLMVMNDAMASTMRRHAAPIGQTVDKNIQRFFPKSQRQLYVNAVAQANVTPAALAALRVHLTASAAAMAQLQWTSCDPYALDLGGATQQLLTGGGDLTVPAGWAVIQRQGIDGGPVQPFEKAKVKNAALGVNGATLAAWIGRAAQAYTDATGAATDHYNAGNGNVILSLNFTPVAGGVHGAVYEFREREVVMAMGQTDAVTNVMTALFNAA